MADGLITRVRLIKGCENQYYTSLVLFDSTCNIRLYYHTLHAKHK